MKTGLLIFGCVLAFVINNLSVRFFQLRLQGQPRSISLFLSLSCLFAAAAYTVLDTVQSGWRLPSGLTLLCGALFALFFFLTLQLSAKGYTCGPVSLTGVLINMSMVLPILYSCLFTGEQLSVTRLIGIGLLVVTFLLSAQSSRGIGRSVSLLWLLVVFGGFLCNGACAIVQKQYRLNMPLESGMQCMAIAYLLTALMAAATFAFSHRRPFSMPAAGNLRKDPPPVSGVAATRCVSSYPRTAGLALIGGLGGFIGNGVVILLSTQVDASLLYPCVNGGVCLMMALVSFTLLREPCSKYTVASLIVGLAAIAVLSL